MILRKINKFNEWLADTLTDVVGSMWCAYAFAALALISLPDALKAGRMSIIQWIAQTFLQLVLLSVILVGQKVQAKRVAERQLKRDEFHKTTISKLDDLHIYLGIGKEDEN